MRRLPRIAVIGDYSEERPNHRATDAELVAAGAAFEWVSTLALGAPCTVSLAGFDGVLVAPGSPYASMEGALAAIRYAREQHVPLLGTCGGFQHVVLEFVRNVLGLTDADHAETNPLAERLAVTPLSCALAGQRHPVQLGPGSLAGEIYGAKQVSEPYFCSYGLNPEFEAPVSAAGLRVSGRDEHGARVVELDAHPFFLATLYVPQARAEDDRERPHPLTAALVKAAAGPWGDKKRTQRGGRQSGTSLRPTER